MPGVFLTFLRVVRISGPCIRFFNCFDYPNTRVFQTLHTCTVRIPGTYIRYDKRPGRFIYIFIHTYKWSPETTGITYSGVFVSIVIRIFHSSKMAETGDPADQPSVERSCSYFLATISAEQPVELGACKPLFKHLRNPLRRFVIRWVREKDPLRMGHHWAMTSASVLNQRIQTLNLELLHEVMNTLWLFVKLVVRVIERKPTLVKHTHFKATHLYSLFAQSYLLIPTGVQKI